MASSSNAATCSGGDAYSTDHEKDEEAMWHRLLQVEEDIQAERAATEPIPRTEEFARNARSPSFAVTKEKLDSERRGRLPTEALFAGSLSDVFFTSSDYGWLLAKLQIGHFKSLGLKTVVAFLDWVEECQTDPLISSPRICFFLGKLLASHKPRRCESRFLKLVWRHSHGISDADLLLCLSNPDELKSPSQEVGNLENIIFKDEERDTLLSRCSTLDKATRFAKKLNEFALHQTREQVEKPKYWTQRDHIYHSVSSWESTKPLETIFPFSPRLETAKACLERLDRVKNLSAGLHPDQSGMIKFVLNSSNRPEWLAVHALREEMELHTELEVQLQQLNGKQHDAYETRTNDLHERDDEFFRACEEEKRNVVQEALYKKAKCLATIKKAKTMSRIVKLSPEVLLSAFEEVAGKLNEAKSLACNTECALCFSEFSKKRKRACLHPCGHAGACFDCATQAWSKKPTCPWCKASIQKPISIPAQLFFS